MLLLQRRRRLRLLLSLLMHSNRLPPCKASGGGPARLCRCGQSGSQSLANLAQRCPAAAVGTQHCRPAAAAAHLPRAASAFLMKAAGPPLLPLLVLPLLVLPLLLKQPLLGLLLWKLGPLQAQMQRMRLQRGLARRQPPASSPLQAESRAAAALLLA